MDPELPIWQRRVAQERRREADRRVGDRRLQASTVSEDRRGGFDRRQYSDRREGATGHVRNALQILQAVHADLIPTSEVPSVIQAAMERLWLALVEIDRLHTNRRAIGQELKSWQSGQHPEENGD